MTPFNKIMVGTVLVVAIGGYVYWSSSQSTSNALVAATSDASSASSETTNPVTTTAPASADTTGSNTSNTPPSTHPGTTDTAKVAVTGAYKDGTYTGAAADSIYGSVQVSATISGGKLSDITFLLFPNSHPHSVDVSNMAMPALKSEAIASQSASVNIVSGATQTSEAFQQTLQSALSQAKA